MYLNKLELKNYGPIEELKIQARFNEDGSPNPIILMGKNGSGKTLSISHILQALLTFKNIEYSDIPEKEASQLYKIQSSSYINNGKQYSMAYTSFDKDENNYVEIMAYNSQKVIDENLIDGYTDRIKNDDRFKKNGLYSNHSGKINYSDSVCLYMPVDRYYIPGWINKEIKSELHTDNRIIGKSDRNIICKTVQEAVESYILNTIIDQQLYDQKKYAMIGEKFLVDGNGTPRVIYSGKNNSIIEFLNFIVSKFNYGRYSRIRLYVGPKGNRKIGLIGVKNDGTEEEIIDSLNKLSTGEYSLLSMFMAILMDYEKTTTKDAFNFQNIKGIVIIDEAELNLHIDLQTKVLPELIKKFKNIQFIITTQSPFLIYGMKDVFGDNCDIYDMPLGIKIDDVAELQEVKNSYNEFIEHNYYLNELVTSAQKQVDKNLNSDMIVITEGKTDSIYLKKAQETLQSYKDLNIKYIGLGTDEANKYKKTGNGALDKLAEALTIIDYQIPIVLLYDADVKIKGLMGKEYLKFFNNIYKMPIPIPSFRNNIKEVCIEHYFKDEEIKRNDSDGHRMFLGNEFNENGVSIDKKLMTEATSKCGKHSYKILDGSGDTKVYLQNDTTKKNLALSKKMFANNIKNNVENFNDFDFTEFENIFKVLLKIKNNRED